MEFPNLGQFNPSSIKGFDPRSLQKINARDIKAMVLENKFEALAVALFLFSLIATGFILNISSSSQQLLDGQLSALQAKAAPISSYKKAVKEKDAILETILPALADENFIFALSEMASKRDIRITDFTPPTITEVAYSKKYNSKFSCLVPDFRTALLFINDLETATHSLSLESLVLSPAGAGRKSAIQQASGDVGQSFGMSLIVSSVEINSELKAPAKNNEK